MALDTRLARMLHVLIHMHLRGGTTTSATLAQMLHTNDVVVRRAMAALREAGMVSSTGGRHGGWQLTRALEDITVLDVHQAIAPGSIFAMGPADDNPACPVERTANQVVADGLREAQAAWLRYLGGQSLAEMAGQLLRERE